MFKMSSQQNYYQLTKETDMSTSEVPSLQGVTVAISTGVQMMWSKSDQSPPSSAAV